MYQHYYKVRSVYSSGSRTHIIFTVHLALPVCAREALLVLHVSTNLDFLMVVKCMFKGATYAKRM